MNKTLLLILLSALLVGCSTTYVKHLGVSEHGEFERALTYCESINPYYGLRSRMQFERQCMVGQGYDVK